MSVDEKIAEIKSKITQEDIPEGISYENFMSKVISDYVIPLFMPLVAVQSDSFEKLTDEALNPLTNIFSPFREKPADTPDRPQDSEDTLKVGEAAEDAKKLYALLSKTPILKQFFNILRAGAYLLLIIKAEGGAVAEKANQQVNAAQRPNILDPQSIMDFFFKDPVKNLDILNELRKHGLSEDDITRYKESKFDELPLGILRTLFFRNEIDGGELGKRLQSLRIRPQDVKKVEFAMKEFATIRDVILFAVREVYSPKQREFLGLDAHRPQEFLDEAAKLGMDAETAGNFWASHWQLPSVQASFEMLHRRKIDTDELRLILRAADFLPRFIDPLIGISYNPYTRVDVRRMYASGVLDLDQVYENYLDLGSDHEHAKNLTKWVETAYGDERKGTGKADITALYKTGAITPEVAKNYLLAIGYSDEAADIIIFRIDYDNEDKKEKVRIKLWQKQFKLGHRNKFDTILSLKQLGYTDTWANDLVSGWELERKTDVKTLSVTQIEKIFKAGLLNQPETKLRLLQAGYTRADSDLLLKLWSLKNND